MPRSPTDPTVPVPLAARRAWLISLPDRPLWGSLIRFFLPAWPEPFLRHLWSPLLTLLIAILGGVVVIFFTTPQASKTGPQSWFLASLISTYYGWIIGIGIFLIMLLTCFAGGVNLKNAAKQAAERRKYEAEQQARLAQEAAVSREREEKEEAERLRRERPFVLKLVGQLNPHKEPYIHEYVEDVYLHREADEAARTTIRAAMNRVDGAPLGICVFGRPTVGKTRLAFEIMRAELADWTFVLWPQNARMEEFDFAAQRSKKVVLWLDDLQKYATSQSDAFSLLELPRYFENYVECLVIIATWRDDEHKEEALGIIRE